MPKNFAPTDAVWKYFYQISAIPRISGNEQKVINYIKDIFTKNKIVVHIDKIGNLIAKVQASKGYEKEPTIILQAHADMVAVKKITSKHDFQKDPIIPLYKDGYLYAKDTNLGADNGSGVAMIMALATDLSYHHGPLEIIVTVQEEVGLVGAKNIESSLIKGKYLINFDGGNKDITMGCNGGIKLNGILNITRQLVTSKENILCLRLYGLLGGHSAQQAKFNHLNAFKGMGYILFNLQNHFKIHLINLKNVSLQAQIPTTCEAYITVDKQDINKIKNKIQVLLDELKEMYQVEKNIQFSNETIKEIDSKKISLLDSKKIINLIYTLPDGQQTFNIHFQKTECSSSINNIYLTNKECYVVIGCRGLFESQKYQLCNQIKQIIELHNGRVELSGDTKGWPINTKYANFGLAYQKFVKEEFTTILPATFSSGGLEPAALIAKIPSIVGAFSYGAWGPNPHTINEKLEVESVYDVLNKIKIFLSSIKKYKKWF